MKSIVDQNGKPFKPSLEEQILSGKLDDKLNPVEMFRQKTEVFDLAALRESCGEPVGTIMFRRHNPFKEP